MSIDELGLFKLAGKNETDHNTIFVDVNIPRVEKSRAKKTIKWNLKASNEKWDAFARRIGAKTEKAREIITNRNESIDIRYKKWFQTIENAARRTIGKTIIKDKKSDKPTNEMKYLMKMKKELKDKIQYEKDESTKQDLILKYKSTQEMLIESRVQAKTAEITAKFEKVINDKSKKSFWDLKRFTTRNHALDHRAVRSASIPSRWYKAGTCRLL